MMKMRCKHDMKAQSSTSTSEGKGEGRKEGALTHLQSYLVGGV